MAEQGKFDWRWAVAKGIVVIGLLATFADLTVDLPVAMPRWLAWLAPLRRFLASVPEPAYNLVFFVSFLLVVIFWIGERRERRRFEQALAVAAPSALPQSPKLTPENAPGQALVRVENTGSQAAVFTATARVVDIRERVVNPKWLQTYRLRWRSNGDDEVTIGGGASDSLVIASTSAGPSSSRGDIRMFELFLEGYVEGQPKAVEQRRWIEGEPEGVLEVELEIAVSSSMVSGVTTAGLIVKSLKWGGIRIEEIREGAESPGDK